MTITAGTSLNTTDQKENLYLNNEDDLPIFLMIRFFADYLTKATTSFKATDKDNMTITAGTSLNTTDQKENRDLNNKDDLPIF